MIHAAARSIRRDKDVDSAPDRIERVLENPSSRSLVRSVGTAVLGEPKPMRARDGDSDRIDHLLWVWPLSVIKHFEPPVDARGFHGF